LAEDGEDVLAAAAARRGATAGAGDEGKDESDGIDAQGDVANREEGWVGDVAHDRLLEDVEEAAG
jgi:hypothetical protein